MPSAFSARATASPLPSAKPERNVQKYIPTRPATDVNKDTEPWSREKEAKALALKEREDRRIAVGVIEDINAFLQTAVSQPRMLNDVLVRAANQFARHPEYARLLSVVPEAAKLYDDMQVALNGIYERNNGILQDPNFNAIDEFLRNGRAMLVPLAPEHPVLPPMSVPVSATEEPRTRAFHRNLVEEEEPLPGISVPINQPAPPATGWWDRIKKTLSRK